MNRLLRHRQIVALLLLIVVWNIRSAPPLIDAQSSVPLILNLSVQDEQGVYQTDIYTWDEASGSLIRRSTWGYNYNLQLSPVNNQLVYTSTSSVEVEGRKVTGGGAGSSLNNLWLMDTLSGNASRVADQPPDAVFLHLNLKGIDRSDAVYSPDGTQIAWTEFDYPLPEEDDMRLMIHDIQQGVTRTVAEGLPTLLPKGDPADVWWTNSGLAVGYYQCLGDPPCHLVSGLFVYDGNGNLLNDIVLRRDDEDHPIVRQEQFVTYQGRDYLAQYLEGSGWQLIDLLTGETSDAPAAPVAISRWQTSDQGIRIGFGIVNSYQRPIVLDANGEAFDIPVSAEDEYVLPQAISPEGDAFVYSIRTESSGGLENNLYLWRDGNVTEIISENGPFTVSQVLWSPLVWIIPE